MERRLKAALCGAVLLAAACARAVPVVAQSASGAPTAARQVADGSAPLGDHHAHIFTRAAISRVFAAPLPAVELPAELDRLLRERERGWNDGAALAPLYTENSLAVSSRRPRWVRGRQAVAEFVAGTFGRAHRIMPIAYQLDGSTGYIAGYFTREIETGTRYFGHAHLTLSRGADGVWRIAAESLTFPGPRVPDPVAAEPDNLAPYLR